MRKPMHRKAKSLAQDHRAHKQPDQDSHSGRVLTL